MLIYYKVQCWNVLCKFSAIKFMLADTFCQIYSINELSKGTKYLDVEC